MFQTARSTRVLCLRSRPSHVSTYPGSNRFLEEKILTKAKEIFAVPPFPHKQVLHNWRFFLKAGKAATGPPVGQEFSKIGLKAMDFAKNFNDRTKPIFKDDVELIVRIQVYFDKSYTYRIEPPPTAWFILRAIRKKRGETSSVSLSGSYTAFLTLEMCYEIAKMKGVRNFDRIEADQPIEIRVRRIIGQARRMGVAIIGVDTQVDSPIGKQIGEWGSFEEEGRGGGEQSKPSSSTSGRGGKEKGNPTDGSKKSSSSSSNPTTGGGSAMGEGKSASASTSTFSLKCVAPSQKLVEKKREIFREMHMSQYVALRQKELDEAPLYERLQYMHHYYPPSAPFSVFSSSVRAGGPTSSCCAVEGDRVIPVSHPHEAALREKKEGEMRKSSPSSSSFKQQEKGDPTVEGRFSTRLLSALPTHKLEEGLEDARLFTALWRVSQPRMVYEKDFAERQAAQRYLQTRGWFNHMSREEMKVVFGDVLRPLHGRRGRDAGENEEEDGTTVVQVNTGRGGGGGGEGGRDASFAFPFPNPFERR